MSTHPVELINKLSASWEELTGGKLVLLHGDEKLARVIFDMPVPESLLSPPARNGASVRSREHEQDWWLLTGGKNVGPGFQLLAYSQESGPWEGLLEAWMQFLEHSYQETAIAIDLTGELIKAWDRMAFLFELTQQAGQSTDTDQVMRALVHSLSLVIQAEDVFLIAEENDLVTEFTATGRPVRERAALRSSTSGSLLGTGLPRHLRLSDLGGDPVVDKEILVSGINRSAGSGMIGFVRPTDAAFDAGDSQLLGSAAELVGNLLEAAKARKTQKQNEMIERELGFAAEIQSSLLPSKMPQLEGYQLAAQLLPARQVGGDFYDAARNKHGNILLLIADVAGKGVPAAILTAIIHSTFHREAPLAGNPSALLTTMNEMTYSDLDKSQAFVTAAVLELEEDSGSFRYSSAGHPDGLIWRGGRAIFERIPATGLPLGVDAETQYPLIHGELEPGDEFLLYSDGISEAHDPQGGLFGVQGITDVLEVVCSLDAKDQLYWLQEGLDIFSRGAVLNDDLAMVLIRHTQFEMSHKYVLPFILSSDKLSIRRTITRIRSTLDRWMDHDHDQDRSWGDNASLAISEIIYNQMEHAYQGQTGLILGNLAFSNEGLIVDLFDRGLEFVPSNQTSDRQISSDPPERGYGLQLVNQLVDEWNYMRRADGKNHWTLRKQILGNGYDEN
jgi:serine phosphatase RsbU (regulator of sigma subunit)/anti-sigma regulatory factor (Ser/Thr protein kinase)